MTTTVNETEFENPERRKLYIESVKQTIEEELSQIIANCVGAEALGKVSIGFTQNVYSTFWKRYYSGKLIYEIDNGHFL